MTAACPEGDARLALGEIHSGLLQHSDPLTAENAEQMLSLLVDHPVRAWERPIRHAVSGPILTGVDCDLPSTGTARTRLRWAALAVDDDQPATVRFMIESDGLRTLKIVSPGGIPAHLSLLVRNLAQHDWLVTTVNAIVDSADHDRRGRNDVLRH